MGQKYDGQCRHSGPKGFFHCSTMLSQHPPLPCHLGCYSGPSGGPQGILQTLTNSLYCSSWHLVLPHCFLCLCFLQLQFHEVCRQHPGWHRKHVWWPRWSTGRYVRLTRVLLQAVTFLSTVRPSVPAENSALPQAGCAQGTSSGKPMLEAGMDTDRLMLHLIPRAWFEGEPPQRLASGWIPCSCYHGKILAAFNQVQWTLTMGIRRHCILFLLFL